MARTSTMEQQVVELLAILLFQHDVTIKQTSWNLLTKEERDYYRNLATIRHTIDGLDDEG